jgi:hypothetical protein
MTPDMFASADDIASLPNMARYVDDWLLPGVLDHCTKKWLFRPKSVVGE